MIDVKKLRATIDARTGVLKAAHANNLRKWNDNVAENKVAWRAAHNDAWRRAVDDISAVLDAGGVVTRDLLPGKGQHVWSEPYSFDGFGPKPRANDYQPPEDVQILIGALDLLDEDEVSHTALARVGINATIMGTVQRWLYRR